jgi:hypothetical protein
MPGLEPGIQGDKLGVKALACRVKPGNDVLLVVIARYRT